MEDTQNTTGLVSVLWAKLVAQVEKSSLRQILNLIGLVFAAGVLSAGLIDVQASMHSITRVLDWNHAAVAKGLLVYAAVFGYRPAKRRIIEFIASFLPGESDEGEMIDMVEFIPVPELLDHLFTEKSLKRDDVKAKFGVPQYRVEALGKKLQELGVLVTGANNAKTLNPAFSRQDVAAILRGKSSASELTPQLRRRQDHFTFDPSAKEIAERVSAPLSPAGFASGFVSRPLAATT
jgi:hypothetical protein